MKIKNLIDIICFAGVFVIMSGLISSSENLLGRVVPAILLVWSANNTVLITKKIYLEKNKKSNLS
ncbi:MAG: hypothetical protein L0J05_04725 [Tetragenococcus halophilus]|uniref:Uncharacterized protein n=1 Tax=Alkalibacterium gilvum TaxID=1130080 RepID=A0A1H6W0Q4_9LACT|nr:hypothetical protein [Alkalibacterium gilvum]MDN6203794.1 hypothetical protein [Tetragenococcus halophilus]SEJ10528.1 hypothetical protein SAMN04488113_1933 [Alkalibacterium gilvum]